MNLSCCWSGSRRKRGLGTQGTGPMCQPAAQGHSGRCPLLMDPTWEWGGRRASGSLWTPLTAAAGMAHGPRRLWAGTARVTHLYSRCTPVARRCRRASVPCRSTLPQPQLASTSRCSTPPQLAPSQPPHPRCSMPPQLYFEPFEPPPRHDAPRCCRSRRAQRPPRSRPCCPP